MRTRKQKGRLYTRGKDGRFYADLRDLGGGREAERKLESMRDSRLGTYGALALVVLLLLRCGTLASLGTSNSLQTAKKPKEVINADPKQLLTKVPLAVVVNQGTAGPAELIAGAVADNHRGEVVGVKTFGIGSVQKLIPLEDGFGLLISSSKYFSRPSIGVFSPRSSDSDTT